MRNLTVVDIIFTDFVNYKKPSMTLMFPYCDMKCDKENGTSYCHNSPLLNYKKKVISNDGLIALYEDNPLSKSFVFQGLEPFDSWEEMYQLVSDIRNAQIEDDIVIYTGFNEDEIKDKVEKLKKFPNIVIKFGRFRPGQEPHYDEVLGCKLASDNQYAEKIS